MSEYMHRQIEKLEPHYSKHVSAMTVYDLHLKSDIAAELAWRDQKIETLRNLVETLRPGALEPKRVNKICGVCEHWVDNNCLNNVEGAAYYTTCEYWMLEIGPAECDESYAARVKESQ
jgi:hypothetical protein